MVRNDVLNQAYSGRRMRDPHLSIKEGESPAHYTTISHSLSSTATKESSASTPFSPLKTLPRWEYAFNFKEKKDNLLEFHMAAERLF